MRGVDARALATILLSAAALFAAEAPVQRYLTLAEAEALALRNHPRLGAARYRADAAAATIAQARAAYLPTVYFQVTGMGADHGTVVAAGAITTSSVASRAATGFTINQLITDFGRTASLTRSAEMQAQAVSENVSATRAQILLQVRQAYFRQLLRQSVLRVAQETVEARGLSLRQVTALQKSDLRSTLDVSFAAVNVSEAELLLFRAQNDIRAATAELSAAMGFETPQEFTLAEEAIPSPLAGDAETLVCDALASRPELIALRLQSDAAQRLADGEKSLRFPTLSLLGTAGVLPIRDEHLRGKYAGGGLNLSIPVFNGNLFAARHAEAELRAKSIGAEVKDLEVRIAQSVRVAWLSARNAFQRLDVTTRLLDQASKAAQFAQTRYGLGLSSIVELSQAQLNKTSAEITAASATYEYQIQRAVLDFETGILK
jgi:outer membrane protein